MLPLHTFHDLGPVGSTNNYAMEAIKNGLASPGEAWFSAHQTVGKGQRGRIWQSEPSKNMALSLALQPVSPFELGKFHYNALIALACLEVLKEFIPQSAFAVKWPNDIYWGDRKAGGILTENLIQGGVWRWAVTGIGLNVNQETFPDLENKAVSLKVICGKELPPAAIAQKLQARICEKLRSTTETAVLMEEFNRYLWKKGEWINLKFQNKSMALLILHVDQEGRLAAQSKDGETFFFHHGEVEWLI